MKATPPTGGRPYSRSGSPSCPPSSPLGCYRQAHTHTHTHAHTHACTHACTHTHTHTQNKVELVLLPRCQCAYLYICMYCVYTVCTLSPYLWHLYIKSSPGLHQGASISMYIRTCCFVTWSVCVCCKVFSSCTNHLCCHCKRMYKHNEC